MTDRTARIDAASRKVAEMIEASKSGARFRGTVPTGTLLGRDDDGMARFAFRPNGGAADVTVEIRNGQLRVL